MKFDGHLYRDQMCLNMLNPDNREIVPGNLCVYDQVLMIIDQINSTTNKDGFVGLGPQKYGDDQSYVSSLF